MASVTLARDTYRSSRRDNKRDVTPPLIGGDVTSRFVTLNVTRDIAERDMSRLRLWGRR